MGGLGNGGKTHAAKLVDEFERGMREMRELMKCGHPKACFLGGACIACERERDVRAPSTIAKRALAAANDAIPQATKDYIKGFEDGAKFLAEFVASLS